MATYAKIPIFLNGVFLEQVTKIQVSADFGIVDVETLEELAGFTNSAGRVEISVDFVIPTEGTEFDFWNEGLNRADIRAQFGLGGSGSFSATGKFTNLDVGQSVGETSNGSFTWRGPLRPME